MKLKNTIAKMLKEYPSLFADRVACLDHLYCVLGNGYHWKNGELVTDWHSWKLDYECGELFELVNLVTPSAKPFDYTFYKLSINYSKIANLPDDIKDDWLQGAIETIQLILLHDELKHNKRCAVISMYRILKQFKERL